MGTLCFFSVFLNNVLAARLHTGEVASFFVEPGEVVFGVGYDPMGKGICSISLHEEGVKHTTETIMKADQKKVFYVVAMPQNNIFLLVRGNGL